MIGDPMINQADDQRYAAISSGDRYSGQLFWEIRAGRRIDPDLWLNPATNDVEVRPGAGGSIERLEHYLRERYELEASSNHE